jgi:hypothetical protein
LKVRNRKSALLINIEKSLLFVDTQSMQDGLEIHNYRFEEKSENES